MGDEAGVDFDEPGTLGEVVEVPVVAVSLQEGEGARGDVVPLGAAVCGADPDMGA